MRRFEHYCRTLCRVRYIIGDQYARFGAFAGSGCPCRFTRPRERENMATTLRYVTIVRERWRTTLITALIVLGTIVAATSLQRPEYEASASIFVRTGTGASVMDRAAAADYVSQQIETYTDLVTTPLVLDPAIESLGLETGARQLSEDVSATVPDDTLLITITARAGTAEEIGRASCRERVRGGGVRG